MKKSTKKQKDEFKQELQGVVAKKIETAMIFPLSQIELFFGHIFGHGKPDNILTNEELANKKKFYAMRQNILDNGNRLKRGALQQIDEYEIDKEDQLVHFISVEKLKNTKEPKEFTERVEA